MKRWASCGVAMAFGLATLAPGGAHSMSDDDNAALAALLAIGVGVAVVASQDKKKHKDDWDHDRYGEPFSPSPDVICLPKPRQWYENGRLSYRWTQSVFGSGGSWASQDVHWGGSFKKSCNAIRTDAAGNLRAECLDERGRRRSASLDERSCRSHGAGNRNGQLVCES